MNCVQYEFIGPRYCLRYLKSFFLELSIHYEFKIRLFFLKKNSFAKSSVINVLKSPFVHKKSHEKYFNESNGFLLFVEFPLHFLRYLQLVLNQNSIAVDLLPLFIFKELNQIYSFFFIMRKLYTIKVGWRPPLLINYS